MEKFLDRWDGFTRGLISSDKPNDQRKLSSIIERESVPDKYMMTARACAGILNRANNRKVKIKMPEHLTETLQALVNGDIPSNSPVEEHEYISVHAFNARQSYVCQYGDISGTLDTGYPGPSAIIGKTIRRLMPVECERLQGFPDNWTAIPYENKSEEDCSDSPRYMALGNSMAIPCISWIGRRITMIEDGH